MTRKNSYRPGSVDYWQRFNEARADRKKRLERLPFAKKVDIIARMQADAIFKL